MTGLMLKVIALTCTLMLGQVAEGAKCTGVWARSGRNPYDAGNEKEKGVIAPSGVRSLVGSDQGLMVSDQTGSTLVQLAVNPPVTEVLWSPDSRYFAVNASDGGLVGTWDATVVDSSAAAIVDRPLIEVKKAASSLPQCETPEQPNLAIAAWLRGGNEILVVAEVPAHSSCRNMAAVAGFRVDVATGTIRERLSASILRRRWPSVLGCRFESQAK